MSFLLLQGIRNNANQLKKLNGKVGIGYVNWKCFFCKRSFGFCSSKQLIPKIPLLKVSGISQTFRRGTLKLTAELSGVPQNVQKRVGWWLMACGGMVFATIVMGGVTRLTESGLSMVTWKLFGQKPPFSLHEWEDEFERYKQYPEFKILNAEITLSEFKFIWWMEYIHRQLGRLVAVLFYGPAAYMWYRGFFPRTMKKRIIALGGLLAFQGLLGWYMVKSGLEDRFHKETDVPRVSQYRLASHLLSALVLYALFLWVGFSHLLPPVKAPVTSQIRKVRMLSHMTKGMIVLTAFSGAFVAGLDAGLVYNSYPKMADRWIPDDLMAYSPKISNITENPTTVQFNHRILGSATVCMATAVWTASRRLKLPPRAHTAAATMAAMAWMQATLGIATLLMYVPVWLASSHQAGSLVLLSLSLWFTHEVKLMKKVVKK